MQINVQELSPTAKDIERAEGLRWRGRTFHGDNSPWRSQASKMAKLIKKPDKLVRRAMAVADMYGTADYFPDTVPPGRWWSDDWKKEKYAWKPFADALKGMGFAWSDIRYIAFRREG